MSSYDPITESKALNASLYGTPTPVPTKVQGFYWACGACNLSEQYCAQEDMLVLANKHDTDNHKGKPMSKFGVAYVLPVDKK